MSTLIYTSTKPIKKKKVTSKSKQLAADWEKLCEKWKPNRSIKPVRKDYAGSELSHRSSTRDIPSLDTGLGDTAKKQSPIYTGDAMIGIGQMHKSNAIPIFKQEDAEALAHMRR